MDMPSSNDNHTRVQPDTRATMQIIATFVLIALIWGSTWLVIKDQIANVPPTWTVAWRMLLASFAMILLTVARGESLRLPPSVIGLSALAGLLQFGINFQFVYRSEAYLTSGVVAVVFGLTMVPNALFSRIFLGIKMSARFLLGSGVAVAGVALLMLHELRLSPPGSAAPLGFLLALAGLLAVSVGGVLQATRLARSHQMFPQIAWSMACGMVFNVALAWASDGPPVFDPRPGYLAGIAYLGLIGSVVTFPLYYHLIRKIGAGPAAYSSVAVPVIAMALSTVFEDYRWTGLALVGAALSMAGLVIALSGKTGAH